MPYLIALLLVIGIATAAWWLVGRRLDHTGAIPGPRDQPPRGPDDDPDFLRDLDRRK